MKKAIRICLIIDAIIALVSFVVVIAMGIVPLALSKQVVEELMKSDPKITDEIAMGMIAGFSASMFFASTFCLFASCTCAISIKKYARAVTFKNKLIITIFNLVAGSTAAGVVMLVDTIKNRHEKVAAEVKE